MVIAQPLHRNRSQLQEHIRSLVFGVMPQTGERRASGMDRSLEEIIDEGKVIVLDHSIILH